MRTWLDENTKAVEGVTTEGLSFAMHLTYAPNARLGDNPTRFAGSYKMPDGNELEFDVPSREALPTVIENSDNW